MGRAPTEKSPYLSKYSAEPTYISAPQYLTELILENVAKGQGEELPHKYWANSQYARLYKEQLAAANSLLKRYSPKAIALALRSRDGQRILSLRWEYRLDPLIKAEQNKLNKSVEDYEGRRMERLESQQAKLEKPPQPFSNANTFSKLD